MSQTKAELIEPQGNVAFDTNTLYVDAGNNRVGIGTTSPGAALQVIAGASTPAAIIDAPTSGNAYLGIRFNGSQIGFLGQASGLSAGTDTDITLRSQNNLVFASNGGNERARIDSSGRLLVGTSSARANFYNSTGTAQLQVEGSTQASSSISVTYNDNGVGGPVLTLNKSRSASVGGNTIVSSGDALGNIYFQGNDGTEFVEAALIRAEVDGTPGANDMPGRLVFSTTADGASSPTERMRIGSNGQTYWGSSAPGAASFGTSIGRLGLAGFVESYRDVNGTFAAVQFGGTAGYAQVMGDGDLENTNNRYTGLSDVKFKQNIEDATSQWDDIKAIQVRKYELIASPERRHIGCVAQELEQVCPGLVVERETQEGETYKSVAYSVLYMKAVKALQEAMERIETLEAKVAALESA